MKILLTSIIILFSSVLIFGQPKKAIPKFESYHKNIFIEGIGSSIGIGVHFDMRLKKEKMDGIGFKAGAGILSITEQNPSFKGSLTVVSFPIEVNHLIGKRRSSFIVGLGILPIYISAKIKGALTNNQLLQDEGFGIAGGYISLGYRFQPRKNGVMFQVNWNPLIIKKLGFEPRIFGIGLGMGFK